MQRPIETFDHMGVTVNIYGDDDPVGTPRDWDNMGVMYCWHPDYELGDEQFSRGDHESMEAVVEYLRDERKARIILPLFLLDHSGLSIRTGSRIDASSVDSSDLAARGRFVGDGAGWDTTMVGFIYCTSEAIRESFLVKRITKAIEQRALDALEGEVETYDQYLSGDIYGFIVDEDGDDEESCWGFYGMDDCCEQAKDAAECVARAREREAAEAAYWAAREVVTV